MTSAARSVPRLQDYDVSEKTGFVLESPATQLPDYFDPWTTLAADLVELVDRKQLRHKVDEMALLDHTKLEGNYKQQRLAHLYLSHIGSAYVFQEGNAGVAKSVPRQLAVPWCGIGDAIGLKPILTLSTVLANYRIADPERPLAMENIEPLCLLPGGETCKQLFQFTVQVELDALPGIKAILSAMQGVINKDTEAVCSALRSVADTIGVIMTTMKSLQKVMKPDVFFHVLSPFLAGFGGKDSPCPDGLIYEGVSDIPKQLKNGNQAQSSSMQCFDAALGIQHGEETRPYLENLRNYMPPKHAQFVVAIRDGPSIKDYVDSSDSADLKTIYNECVESLKRLRSYHITIATRFVVQQMRREEGGMGSPPEFIPLLKSIRDTTTAPVAVNEGRNTDVTV